MSEQQQTFSIPSLLILGVLGVIAARYFFFRPISSTTQSTNARAANPQDVEQIVTMFPQIPRRNIIWDLQRNRGSVTSTTERILSQGILDTPPPTFQPATDTSNPRTPNTAPSQRSQDQSDLIKRYKLEGRLSSQSTPSEDSRVAGTQANSWSNNKNERQALLQRRREDMVLNARRKMEEKERGKQALAGHHF